MMRVIKDDAFNGIDVYPWDDSDARIEINHLGEVFINWYCLSHVDPALVIKKLETVIEAVKIGVDEHNKCKQEVGR